MKIVCAQISEIKKHVENYHLKIVLFGTGTIGKIAVPEVLNDYNLLSYVDCFLDNDKKKVGQVINYKDMVFEVHSADYLSTCSSNTAVFINISRYSDVLDQIDSLSGTENMECYIFPMLLINEFCSSTSIGESIKYMSSLIPKKLHYMWLGGNPIPDKLKRCMESWYKYCPDYEIVEWNENNYDIDKHLYMKQAYENKAYGFVPDYARLDILYNEGGLYLDTDVELRRNIDDLLFQEAFCGVEKWQVLNFGGLSGAVKGHPMIKKFLDARKEVYFIEADGRQNRNTCGFYDTTVAINEGYKINGQTQNIGGMNIYAYDYFHPYDYMSGIVNETENTHSIHWFNGGWLDEKMKKANEESKAKYMDLYNRALNTDI